MSSVMARLAHQEEVQKTTNDQLAAIVAALSAPTGNSQPFRRHLFNTNPPTPTDGRTTNPADPAETLTPRQDDDGDVSADEDQPAVRQRIEVIRAQPESSSDEESELEEAPDSRAQRQKNQARAESKILTSISR
ncbi:hypothetical protein F2Q69_00012652 [Brassica cretica]|uniref:Uncharacterized protein n=1 Tax=Brassica cretica TaxID=69181 RepID=A0A8S9R1U1_BRACR|nr:hypothetical protein F2Q69_00012652 [Brassica cretica]